MKAAMSQPICESLSPNNVLEPADRRRETDSMDIRDDSQATCHREDLASHASRLSRGIR